MPPHRRIFNVAMTGISRVLVLRERMLGRIGAGYRGGAVGVVASPQSILRGGAILDAVFVQPENEPPSSAVLLCHGIGEVVDQWFPVQALLAQHGVGSLVFDYSGYGRSNGAVDWAHWEDDAVAAFECLERLVAPMPVSMLGFSMGSGVAAAVIRRISAKSLILCASFTSFRAGAHSLGLPTRALPLVPPIWTTDETLADCTVPVLLVHGDQDQLFPVQMARDLAALPHESKLVVVKNLRHSEPFHRPDISYWGHIVRFLED
jgi:alpha-beta hydrolase superfamily lysophospholipase